MRHLIHSGGSVSTAGTKAKSYMYGTSITNTLIIYSILFLYMFLMSLPAIFPIVTKAGRKVRIRTFNQTRGSTLLYYIM